VAAPDGFTAEGVIEAPVNQRDLADVEPDERKTVRYTDDTARIKLLSAVGVDAMFASLRPEQSTEKARRTSVLLRRNGGRASCRPRRPGVTKAEEGRPQA